MPNIKLNNKRAFLEKQKKKDVPQRVLVTWCSIL
jgi:hypothetical protein